MKKATISFLFAVFCALLCQSVQAISLNPFKREGRTTAQYLLVTGNFLESRLLAELAQHRSKQPILLFSKDASGNYQLFYMPPGDKTEMIAMDKMQELIQHISPKQIIFLGDEDYIPSDVVNTLRESYQTLVINSKDWGQNASVLGSILKYSNLQRDFLEYRTRVKQSNEAAK